MKTNKRTSAEEWCKISVIISDIKIKGSALEKLMKLRTAFIKTNRNKENART